MADDDDEWNEFRTDQDEEPPAVETAAPARSDDWAQFRLPQQEPQRERTPQTDEWAQFRTQPEAEQAPRQQQQQPQAEGMVGTAAREVAHGVLPFLASIPGAEAGAALGGTLGSFIPIPGVGTTVGAIGGGLIGAGLAAAGASTVQEAGAKALGIDDAQQRAINAATNPTAALAGQLAPMAAGFGTGVGRGLPLIQRGLGAALGGGMEAGQEAVSGEGLDPTRIAAGAATGAVFARPRGWVEGIQAGIQPRVGPMAEQLADRLGLPRPGRPDVTAADAAADKGAVQPAATNPAAVETQGTSRPAVPPDPNKPPVSNEPNRPPDEQNAAVLGGTGERETAGEPPPDTTNYGKTQREGTAEEAIRRRAPTEEPTQYGPLLEREFPRVPEGTETVPPTAPRVPGVGADVQAALQAAMPTTESAASAEARAAPRPELVTQQQQGVAPEQPPAAAERAPMPENLPRDPTALRALAASVRRDGNERLAAQYEDAAGAIEASQRRPIPRAQQQAQQIQPEGQEEFRPPNRLLQQQEQPPPQGPTGAAPAGGPPRGPPLTLQPATRSDLQQGVLASLRRHFGGLLGIASESSQKAQAALRQAYGPLARLRDQAATRLTNDLHRLANSMDRPAFERFVDAYESGKVDTLPPDQQRLGKALEQNYGDFWKQIKKLSGADKMEATKNYLTHMYDNSSGQVDNFTNNWYGAGGGSLRKRSHPTFADARAAGLQPLSNNPIEHFVRYSEGISQYLAQRQMMADLESQGLIGHFAPKAVGASGAPDVPVKGAPPEGYEKIEVPWTAKQGQDAYAPRDIATTINQFYDAGLRRAQTKDIYEFARQTKNAWTAVELGLSAYHATTMGTESIASGMSRALQIASRGDFVGATKELLKAPTEPVMTYLYGRQGRQIYRDPTGTVGTPIQRQIMDVLTRANILPGNLKATRDYDMSQLGNFWDAYKRGSLMNEINNQIKEVGDSYGLKLPKVLLDNVRRAMQTISKPLFEHYIPALKLGTMMKDMEAWYHANPNATDEQALAYARRVVDSIDNRMGEMNYNNVFMNKTAKDLAMLTLRSFGFTVGGPFREIGAGVGSGIAAIAKGKNPLADPRTAYAMAFMPTIAAISAAYQYLRTGEGPSDWRDLVTPRTGGKVKSVGQQVPERILVPGYHKDFLGYFVNPRGPVEELKAKTAAPWTAIIGQLTGKDWRDKPYVPPRATTLEWLQAHAQALASHLAPIAPKQLAEGKQKGSALTLPEQMIGVRTPGAYMLNPKGLEAYLTKQAQRDWRAQEIQENRARQQRGLPPLPPRKLPRPQGYRRGGYVAPQNRGTNVNPNPGG